MDLVLYRTGLVFPYRCNRIFVLDGSTLYLTSIGTPCILMPLCETISSSRTATMEYIMVKILAILCSGRKRGDESI